MARTQKSSSRTKAAAKPLKNEMLRVRVSAEQKTGLEAAAAKAGLDLSSWIRQLLLREAGLLPTVEAR